MKCALDIQGKNYKWSFPVEIDPKYLDEWRKDGLVIDEVLNTIPDLMLDFNLPIIGKHRIPFPPTKLWCWLQDKSNILFWSFVTSVSIFLTICIIRLF